MKSSRLIRRLLGPAALLALLLAAPRPALAHCDGLDGSVVKAAQRAGEGAPYTGLKPAGRDLGPAIPAADRALETGDPAPLLRLLAASLEKGAHERFHETVSARLYRPDDVPSGRKYVARYVTFVHYVERLFKDAAHPAEGHFPDEPESATEAHGHGAH